MKVSPKESVNLCYGEHKSTKRCGARSRRQRTGIRTVLSCENDTPWRYAQLHLPLRKSSALARASRQADSSQPASESRPYGNCCHPHVHLSPKSTSSIPDSPPVVTEHRGQGPGALITIHLLTSQCLMSNHGSNKQHPTNGRHIQVVPQQNLKLNKWFVNWNDVVNESTPT